MNEDLHSRMARLEVHSEYTRDRIDAIEGKVDKLLARPSTLGAVASFLAAHWKALLIVALTLSGVGWAAPILAALK